MEKDWGDPVLRGADLPPCMPWIVTQMLYMTEQPMQSRLCESFLRRLQHKSNPEIGKASRSQDSF